MDRYYYAGLIFVYAVPESELGLLSSNVKKPTFILSGFLLLVAVDSMALSLGRHRGVAIIGRPFDASVQATLDTQDDPANICLEADVFFGDRRLGGSAVRVTSEKAGSGPQDILIRIRASALIDEPVVMIYLRAGCQQKTERRYVMLADLVSEADTPMITLPSTGAVSTGAASRAPFISSSPQTIGASSAGNSSAAPVRRPRTRPATASAPAGSQAADVPKLITGAAGSATDDTKPTASTGSQRARSARAPDKTRARLKLEPLDLTIDRDPTLKASSELLSVPAATEQERSVAAALWRALTAQPQDILRDGERLQTLENAIRNLQSQSQKNQMALTELNSQLQQARSERYANFLVYALLALLLAAIAAIAYLWRQRGLLRITQDNELPWWRKNKSSEKGWADSARDDLASKFTGTATAQNKIPRKEKNPPGAALDLDLGLSVDESGFSGSKHLSSHDRSDSLSSLPSREHSDFALSMTHMARAVKAEELFDVQQQADFFVSLGQHEQAIEVLRNHISDNAQTSALVYLDLVNLYHLLNRKADYEALREDFNELFNAKIPVFDLYSDSSPGLESYQGALSRIEALWPSPKVLDIIEESIFRKPDTQDEVFDLGAYRELLLLYAVAKEIISPEANRSSNLLKFDLPHSLHDEVNVNTTKFLSTAIQPLSASVVQEFRGAPALDIDDLPELPKPSPRLGLDLDLSDLNGDEVSRDAEPELDAHFFEQFAENAIDEEPKLAAPIPVKPAALTDNLIDFESFDSVMDSVARKPPPKA